MAEGDFIVLADHDDRLTPNALFEVREKLNENENCDVLYSDEDKLDMDGGALFDPHFKPDFNPDLFDQRQLYLPSVCGEKELLDQVGGFRQEFDGAQDYDFIFRCTENAKEICHIPKVLYHWRCHQNSTASNPESKLYAFEAVPEPSWTTISEWELRRRRWKRVWITAFTILPLRSRDDPLVSVIIPNKDHTVDLDNCIRPMLDGGTYKNLEFVMVENNSTEQATFDYYEKIQKEFPNVHVVRWERSSTIPRSTTLASARKGRIPAAVKQRYRADRKELFGGDAGLCARERTSGLPARDCSMRMTRSSMPAL